MKKHVFITLILLAALTLFSATPALAVQLKAQSEYVVPAGKSVTEDLYVAAQTIVIEGTVEGDVFLTGDKIDIKGNIQGDLLAAGDIIEISGKIDDDVKLVGVEIKYSGEAGDSVMAAGQTVRFTSSSRLGGDLYAAAETLEINGKTGGLVKASANNISIQGSLGGDTVFRAGDISLKSGSSIGGNLKYTSVNELEKAADAAIDGTVKRQLIITEKTPLDTFFGLLGTFTWKFLQVVTLGLLLIYLLPTSVVKVKKKLSGGYPMIVGCGILYFLLSVLVILSIFITIIGIPIGIIALSLFMISVDLAKVYVSLWSGEIIAAGLGRKDLKTPVMMLLVGAALYSLLALIPYLGFFAEAFYLFFGLGAIALASIDFIKKTSGKRPKSAA